MGSIVWGLFWPDQAVILTVRQRVRFCEPVLAYQYVVFSGVAEEEPGGYAPPVDQEVGLEGLAEGIGRFAVVACDPDALVEFVEGRAKSLLDGLVEPGADEGFAVGSGVQQGIDFKGDVVGGEMGLLCYGGPPYDVGDIDR